MGGGVWRKTDGGEARWLAVISRRSSGEAKLMRRGEPI